MVGSQSNKRKCEDQEGMLQGAGPKRQLIPGAFASMKEASGVSTRKRKVHAEMDGEAQGAQLTPQVRVRKVEYAKYGVVEGAMTTGNSYTPRCTVVSGGWPSWAFGAIGAGGIVVDVVLFNGEWESTVRRMLPEAQIIVLARGKGAKTARAVEIDEVDFVYCDIDPPGLVKVWEVARRAVVSSRRCRRIPAGWKEDRIGINHSEWGGVTTTHVGVHVYTREGETRPVFESPGAGLRDLSTVLDPRARHGTPTAAPGKISLPELRVEELPGKRDVFHGSGWLPGQRRDILVVTPNEFSKTKWCRRTLTPSEWLQVLDFPVGVIKSLTDREKESLVRDISIIPLKAITPVCGKLQRRQGGEERAVEVTIQCQSKANCADVKATVGGASEPVGGASKPAQEKEKCEKDRTAKATKSDDAAVPEYLWDDRLLEKLGVEKTVSRVAALNVFRVLFVRWWKRRVTTSFLKWWLPRRLDGQNGVAAVRLVVFDASSLSYRWTAKGRKQYKAMRNSRRALDRELAEDAWDAIRRSADSTWWEWSEGSFPFFWRWPEWYQTQIRVGGTPWLSASVPKCAIPQRKESDEKIFNGIRNKLLIPILRRYLEEGLVHSLTSFFAVPKGEDDIRMVYDGTRSGLNDAMFAPWFPLPTVEQLLRVVETESYMGDIDVGEMFLNFVMHKSLRIFCGVDVTPYFPEMKTDTRGTVWLRWSRCGMGFKNSPYVATQGMGVAEEVMLGDPSDEKNAFRWDTLVLNLPGMADYDPSKAWVAKIRYDDGRVACDVFIYVDDLRTVGPTRDECWQASRTVASVLNWLGLQDAARKRRPPSQEPGAWAGSIVHSSGDQVEIMVSQERWDKSKKIIAWITEQDAESGDVEFKALEKHRGFLVYISRTYPNTCSFLKGIHQTLDSWRPWRREDGWKMTVSEMRVVMEEAGTDMDEWVTLEKAPPRVKSAPRLKWDLEALTALFKGDEPVRRKVRPSQSAVAIYGFGDASGKGFGSSFVVGNEMIFRHGQWAERVEKESSNYRELANLVLAVEEACDSGKMQNCELFLFTDNTTAEGCYYRGTSQSRKLFELILRLRKLQMAGDMFIHVIHIAGTRMIEEGTDGLSRGNINEGVMTGKDILSYIPLHLSALERQEELTSWVLSWAATGEEANNYKILAPGEWYTTGQREGHCIWMPPPAAADVAVELLGKAKHKRPLTEHIFVCPRLMTNRWRKQLSKVCDLLLTIPVGTHFWGVHQHEPLLVGIAFPLISVRPWRLRNATLLERTVSELSGLPPASANWGGSVLQQLLSVTRKLESMPEGLVWEVLHPP